MVSLPSASSEGTCLEDYEEVRAHASRGKEEKRNTAALKETERQASSRWVVWGPHPSGHPGRCPCGCKHPIETRRHRLRCPQRAHGRLYAPAHPRSSSDHAQRRPPVKPRSGGSCWKWARGGLYLYVKGIGGGENSWVTCGALNENQHTVHGPRRRVS